MESEDRNLEPETRDDGNPAETECEEPVTSTSRRLGSKRRRSDLSSDGDEGDHETDDSSTSTPNRLRTAPELGSLHKRRASASPEKFNEGRFEPLPLRPAQPENSPPHKKTRINANVKISYDATGTPRIASWSSDKQNEEQNADLGQLRAKGPSTSQRAISHAASIVQQLATTPQLLKEDRPSPRERAKGFNIITAFCHDNDLLLHLVSFLSIPPLLSIYAISRPFHYLFNRHHTAFILSCMRTWAPNADRIYPWRCYKSLCAKDPSKRQKVRLLGRENEVKEMWDDLRDVPSIRWLKMVVWREGVCRDMLIQLGTQGLKCPAGTLDSIKRMWFILDLPLNAHRIALIRNPDYISDGVLFGINFFLIKVDMHFTDPIRPPYPINNPNRRLYADSWLGGLPSGVPLRKMLLEERNLTPLWRVIRGWSWDPQDPQRPMTRLDILRLWIRHKYTLPEGTPENVKKMSIMGIPWHDVGNASLERTGVSFHNLGDKQVSLTHPSITGPGRASQARLQTFYPHQRRIVLEHEKEREVLLRPDELIAREVLLRPDELIAREGLPRKLDMHKHWAWMMCWGFCDESGMQYPVWTEKEQLRMLKGLPPRPLVRKEDIGSNEEKAEHGSNSADKGKVLGHEV